MSILHPLFCSCGGLHEAGNVYYGQRATMHFAAMAAHRPSTYGAEMAQANHLRVSAPEPEPCDEMKDWDERFASWKARQR